MVVKSKQLIMKSVVGVLLGLSLFVLPGWAQTGVIVTVAGNGSSGISITSGSATSEPLNQPGGIFCDAVGNIYFSDSWNNRICKVDTLGGFSIVAGTGMLAGTGSGAYGGDGWAATAANLYHPLQLALDGAGNLIFADAGNNRVRKIDTSGIITTVAGKGVAGFTGDGGMATGANLNNPTGVAVDLAGNIYIADAGNNRIRKVSTTGLISTFAGNGIPGYSGDGVPAIATSLFYPSSIAADTLGNIYIADQLNNRIRMVSPAGMITTFAGVGVAGFSGDGGPAVAASLSNPCAVKVDAAGNLLITDFGNYRLRKIVGGNINTVAGTGTSGYSGDGGLAGAARIYSQDAVTDGRGNVVLADGQNNRVRKITFQSQAASDSLNLFVAPSCGTVSFSPTTTSTDSGLYAVIQYGDGTGGEAAMPALTTGGSGATITHIYPFTGTYTVKVVLWSTAGPIDSVTTNVNYRNCGDYTVFFYNDANGNCMRDSSEPYLTLPVLTRVDSAGVAVAMLSATSGFTYHEAGPAGTLYTFTVVSSSGQVPTCPSTGVFYDTVGAGGTSITIGFNCTDTSSQFDLAETPIAFAYPAGLQGAVAVSNKRCMPQSGGLKLTFDPKFAFSTSIPAADSVSGNSAYWSVGVLNATDSLPNTISFTLAPASGTLTVGDTVLTKCALAPAVGDADTTNNYWTRVDTVRAALPAAQLTVSPQGAVFPGTKLQYVLAYTNPTGARIGDLRITDTLPTYIDLQSLRMDAVNRVCIVEMESQGGYNIVHFDITDGLAASGVGGSLLLAFSARVSALAPLGAVIANDLTYTADGQPSTVSNTVTNWVQDTVSGSAEVCVGATALLSMPVVGGLWGCSNSNATIAGGVVTGVMPGLDTVYYTVRYPDTSFAASIVVSIGTIPTAGAILGDSSVCTGVTDTLADSVTGGVWVLTNGWASITPGGILTGVTAGMDTVNYIVSNACGADTARATIHVRPSPFAGAIIGPSGVCLGSTTTYSDSASGGNWSVSQFTLGGYSYGYLHAAATGVDTVKYTVTNSCGVAIAQKWVTVDSTPYVSSVTGPGHVCVGATATLSGLPSGGLWTASNVNLSVSGGIVSGLNPGLDTVTYTQSNACGNASLSRIDTVYAVPKEGAISGPSILCVGLSVTLIDTTLGGTWSVANISAVVGSGGLLTAVNVGVDTVFYSVNNICGTASTTLIVSVDAVPTPGVLLGSDSVCVGTTIPIISTAAGGHWRSTNIARALVDSVGVVTGVSRGNDTIVYKVSGYCGSDSSTFRIYVNEIPHVSPISAADSICVSATFAVFDSVPGGSWAFSNNTAAVFGSTMIRGISGPANDTLYYNLGNSCGTGSASKVVFVEPLPSTGNIITGDSIVCVGDSVHFTAMAFNDSASVWSSSNPLLASISSGSPFLVGLAAGIDTVRFGSFNHCGSAFISKPVTVAPVPDAGTIVGPDSVCVGATVTFADTVVGGSWISGGSGISINPDGLLTGIAPGSDSVVYKIHEFCGTATVAHAIIVAKPPSASITGGSIVCIGKNDTLFGNPAGGAWTDVAGDLTVDAAGIVTGIIPGSDSVLYTVTNVCGSKYDEVAVTVLSAWQCDSLDGTALIGNLSNAISVAPNPTHGGFEIHIPGMANDVVVGVCDVLGRPVEIRKVPDYAAGNIRCQLPDSRSGTYILTVKTAGAVSVIQLVLLGQ